ncbi:hypothetical protein GCM10010885_16960 [Alicyclobacillus cellulosilyticus]|uniref:Uncharacterized protein n=1 Tax=Alicyclobacillus cellulosilyticus TaxID=1003997 RepID=A0A917KCQ3_9BACL|nr:hypothetical protein [Alicyclobacillus cellulosilyticus]GGJ08446.1 hypothetical protein GCM10010885_16960 [Alicyclobacillus cellulosilyticus]
MLPWLRPAVLLVIHILALAVILSDHDPLELWVTGLYGVYVVLLVLLTDRDSS